MILIVSTRSGLCFTSFALALAISCEASLTGAGVAVRTFPLGKLNLPPGTIIREEREQQGGWNVEGHVTCSPAELLTFMDGELGTYGFRRGHKLSKETEPGVFLKGSDYFKPGEADYIVVFHLKGKREQNFGVVYVDEANEEAKVSGDK